MGVAVVEGTGDKGDQRKGIARRERPGQGRGALLGSLAFLDRQRPPPPPPLLTGLKTQDPAPLAATI